MAGGLHSLNVGQMQPGSDLSVGQVVDSSLLFKELSTWLDLGFARSPGPRLLHLAYALLSTCCTSPLFVMPPEATLSPSSLISSGERWLAGDPDDTEPFRGDS